MVYSSIVFLGQDSEEIQLLARVLAESSQLNKLIVLCVGLKGLTNPYCVPDAILLTSVTV